MKWGMNREEKKLVQKMVRRKNERKDIINEENKRKAKKKILFMDAYIDMLVISCKQSKRGGIH